ncbi:hypothetical protein NEMBOFW57_004131 [Staphylotrichum longicolle]|uniref:Uncharacterized protein n=1 Tax=Staphylotrichum longicolle TaxID=669026 RepID=A0AAD4F7D0_9PEZI|nr:hypothetical protein NEMBOFW57_004131 [Staphylotrichum longicolle]
MRGLQATKLLHDRIRRLEKTCTDHGIPIPPLDPGDGDSENAPAVSGPSPLSPLAPGQRRGSSFTGPNPARSIREHASSPSLRPPPTVTSPDHERLDATESTASVTAMGTVSTEHDVYQAFDANEFYGSSSAASFMKEACTSVKPRRQPLIGANATGGPNFSVNFARSEPITALQFAQADKFALPPRNLADHLLNKASAIETFFNRAKAFVGLDFIDMHNLGEILSNVYQPPTGGFSATPLSSWDEHKSHGMDAILELDAKTLKYEAALPPAMSWTSPSDIDDLDDKLRPIIVTQRTVLRGSASTAGQELFTSFAAGCAKICLGAAIDLIELVHSTYLSNTTGGWWWDGLYAVDKDHEQPLPTLAIHNHGEAVGSGLEAAVMHPEDMPLDLGSSFQWQLPVGSDMLGAGLVFNWDQSLDLIAGGLGMDLYQ